MAFVMGKQLLEIEKASVLSVLGKLWTSVMKQWESNPKSSQLRCFLNRKILIWFYKALVRPYLEWVIRMKHSVLKGMIANWNRFGEEPSGRSREQKACCRIWPCLALQKEGWEGIRLIFVNTLQIGRSGRRAIEPGDVGTKPNGYRLPINTLDDQITWEDGF